MGEKDKIEKLLEDYSDVFADIINVLVYQGEEVVKPEELRTTNIRSQYKASDDVLHEEERDTLKEWNNKKGFKVLFGIENHKPIKHVDEMLKFMRIFAEDERFLQLDVKKNEEGEVTMCTILDTAINKGIEQGISQGISQGITQGIAQGKIIGENATLQLVKILLANNKIQDIDKIYNDIQYRNKLMEEYKIYERI